MRISGGTARGARLRGTRRGGVRPTSDRVKDALFNTLRPILEGARVLDLFAGTGRLGIEALSRGAQEAVFVERAPRNAALIKENLAGAGLIERGTVRRANVLTEVATLGRRGETFDLILLDPPYGQDLQAATLRAVAVAGVLAAGGLAVAEGHWRDDPGTVQGLERVREARYGETAVWFYNRKEGGA